MPHGTKTSKPNTETMVVNQRNWLDVPYDVTANILQRVGVFDILENAQKVCTAWRKICKDPAMWRVIDMESFGGLLPPSQLEKMCMHAIDRSQGQLVDLNMQTFPTNDLIQFLAQGERSSQLRRLQISYGSLYESWSNFLEKAPLLEEIALTFTIISKETVADVSRYCPMLKSFIYNNYGWKYIIGMSSADDFVIAIAKGMPQLLHLQLTGSKMTNKGLYAILHGCPNLQSLDLRGCFDIDLNESCGKLCKERIKNLRLPGDSTEGHKVAPYDSEDDYDYNDMWYGGLTESSDDDDYSGIIAEYYSLL
ncbi:putative F-box/LRR-repeat protein 23 [Heracleum sosnowskyi]|uniref:F-box/LRR-repeat protein 23 n=1 Tax=Heracleum sosnowskyi TaxID=360622 RepID=A0AAD8HXZ1_9APIA|nr:putative F-box/LRR-repeat protein 23 [Heracleum sosnowskyi]